MTEVYYFISFLYRPIYFQHSLSFLSFFMTFSNLKFLYWHSYLYFSFIFKYDMAACDTDLYLILTATSSLLLLTILNANLSFSSL